MRRLVSILLWVAVSAGIARGDFSESVLTELQGVGLDVRPLNVQSDSFAITPEELESQAFETLRDLKVRVLSDLELDLMPGQPYLEISVDLAHAQGPSHVYVVEIELREMAQLERPRESLVTMAVSTWDRKSLGIANRPEAVYAALDRLLRTFAREYRGAQE